MFYIFLYDIINKCFFVYCYGVFVIIVGDFIYINVLNIILLVVYFYDVCLYICMYCCVINSCKMDLF